MPGGAERLQFHGVCTTVSEWREMLEYDIIGYGPHIMSIPIRPDLDTAKRMQHHPNDVNGSFESVVCSDCTQPQCTVSDIDHIILVVFQHQHGFGTTRQGTKQHHYPATVDKNPMVTRVARP